MQPGTPESGNVDVLLASLRQAMFSDEVDTALNLAELLSAHIDNGMPPDAAARLQNAVGAVFLAADELERAAGVFKRAADNADLAGEPELRARIALNQGLLAAYCGFHEAGRLSCAKGRAALAAVRPRQALRGLVDIALLWLLEYEDARIEERSSHGATCLAKAAEAAEQAWREVQPSDTPPDLFLKAADALVCFLLKLPDRVARARACFDQVASRCPDATDALRYRLMRAEVELAEGHLEVAQATLLPQDGRWQRCAPWYLLRQLELLAKVRMGSGDLAGAAPVIAAQLKLMQQHARRQVLALPLLVLDARASNPVSSHDNLTYMVHDVRAPLGRIIATLRDGDPAVREAQACAVAERTLGRIDALMRYTRLDTLAPANRTVFDMGSVVDDACEELMWVAEECGVLLSREIDFKLPVFGHKDAVFRSLVNLIDNALKVSPPGNSVEVSCHVQSADALRVVVSDQGPGLPLTYQTMLLEMARAPYQGGSPLLAGGFGLRYVARVARMHGAAVDIDAKPTGCRIALTFCSRGGATRAS
jgi:signal transduction histidine kinase